MSLVTIGSVVLPTPSELNVGIQNISKAERNARGTMIIERIATKRKLELQWKYLTPSQLSTVLNAVDPVFFSVTYQDPQTNASRTATFYSGDRTLGMFDFQNGVPRYKDVKFSLIER
jgi:predicted molibdopterin-dependent oxidoreductase YjgC